MIYLSQTIATNLDRIKVQEMFPDIIMVVPSRADRARVNNATGIPMSNLVASSIPPGGLYNLTLVRHFMQKYLIDPGDEYLIVNDNVRGLIQVSPELYSGTRIDFEDYDYDRDDWVDAFAQPCRDPMAVVHELFEEMYRRNTVLAGIGGMENYFYRKYKWSTANLVRGDFFIGINDPNLDWCPRESAMPTWDDWYRTCQVLARCGKVVINRWVMPDKQEYEAGGLGPEETRTEAKRICARFLALKYRGIVELDPKRDDGLKITKEAQWASRS